MAQIGSPIVGVTVAGIVRSGLGSDRLISSVYPTQGRVGQGIKPLLRQPEGLVQQVGISFLINWRAWPALAVKSVSASTRKRWG